MKTTQIARNVLKRGSTIYHNLPVYFKKIKSFTYAHPYSSLLTMVLVVLLISMIAFPRQGEILPVDPYVVHAYSILGKTATGKNLIKRVKKSTAGSFVYLSLGTTKIDRLIDFNGDTVRGVTRVTYDLINRTTMIKRVAVITNRDLVGTAPRDIIRSIAFELENVDYAFRNPQIDFPRDSPTARQTQQKIMDELDL